MSKLKKWALGVGIIVLAVSTYLVATLDSDPATEPKLGETIQKVKEGVEVIRKEEAPAPVPAPTVETPK